MDKTIATKIPETDVGRLEKIAASRGESISSFVRDLVRKEIDGVEKEDRNLAEILTMLRGLAESKLVRNPAQNSDPATAKKIEEVIKLLSGFPPELSAQIGQLRDEIGQIPKVSGEGNSHPEFVEILKRTERAVNELKQKIGGVGFEAGTSVSFKNPEFWKKSLAIVGIWSLIFAGITGWGSWKIYRRGTDKAVLEGIGMASPVFESFYHLMQCDRAGWKAKWDKDGKKLYCYPYADKDGKVSGWRIQ